MLKKLRSKISSFGGNSSQSVHPVGCDVLYEGLGPISADVVFIHGLGGHRTRTWTKDNVFWPQDLLPKDLPGVRLIYFGYDANISNFLQSTSTNNIHYHARALIDGMLLHRRNDPERPMIFVCHSLGGIICKDALDYSNQNTGFQPSLAQFVSSCKGIIFLATPHRGSATASLAVYAARIAQAALLDANETTPTALAFDSEVLERISDAFARLLASQKFDIHSYFEELQTPGIGIVVDRNSAVIGDAYEKTGTIYSNHQDICRFSDSNYDGYQKILASIQELIGYSDQKNDDNLMMQSQGSEKSRASSVTNSDTLYEQSFVSESTIGPFVTPEAKIRTAPRRLKALLREEGGSHVLSVFFEDRCLNIQFHRTLRVPDDGQTYDLPVNLGTFPLFNVADFKGNLSPDAVEKGGLFLPMFKREALWISLHEEGNWKRKSRKIPFAIRIYTGGINAVSGEPMRPKMATFVKAGDGVRPKQDYLVFPDQHWIDGTTVNPAVVRQFLSEPYDSGFSIEHPITELEPLGGIQIEVIPASAGMRITVVTKKQFYVYLRPDDTVACLQDMIADREGAEAHEYSFTIAGEPLERTNTLAYYNIKEGSVIHCDWINSPDQTLSDLRVYKESVLRLVLRLRGGEYEPAPIDPAEIKMMATAAGGEIKQAIVPDRHLEEIWRPESSALFNIRLVNPTRFKEITGMPAPSTPIKFQVYRQMDMPFYKLFDEPESTICADFSASEPDTGIYRGPIPTPTCSHCGGVELYCPLIKFEPCNHKACRACFHAIPAEPIKICPVAGCGKMIIQAPDFSMYYDEELKLPCHDTIRPCEVMPLRLLAEQEFLPQRFRSINPR